MVDVDDGRTEPRRDSTEELENASTGVEPNWSYRTGRTELVVPNRY